MTLGDAACSPTHANSKKMNNPMHFCFITLSQANGAHYNTGRHNTRMLLIHFRTQASPWKSSPPVVNS